MSNLTKNDWPRVKIGDVCKLMTGGTPSRSKPEYFAGDIKWLVSGDIHQKEITDCEGRISELGMVNSNAKLLPINSVMIALNGQGKTRGTVAKLRVEATCNQSLVSIMPKECSALMPEFLYMNLHGRYEEIRRMTGDAGNERRGLNMRLIKEMEFPLPPLEEQKRIVTVLDEAFTALDRARTHVETNLKNARELFESHIEAAFSTQNAKSFKKLEECVDVVSGYSFSSMDFAAENLIKSIKITNVGVREFVEADASRLPKNFLSEYSRFSIPEGSIVIALTRSIIAQGLKVAIVPKAFSGALLNQRVAALKIPEGGELRDYLYLFLCSSSMVKYVQEKANTLMQPNLSINDLKKLPVPMPEAKERKQLVATANRLSDEVSYLKKIYQEQISDIEDLRQSLLQKAFSGELT